jgi:hypothetical protein
MKVVCKKHEGDAAQGLTIDGNMEEHREVDHDAGGYVEPQSLQSAP